MCIRDRNKIQGGGPFKPLTSVDHVRIKMVLDYWYDDSEWSDEKHEYFMKLMQPEDEPPKSDSNSIPKDEKDTHVSSGNSLPQIQKSGPTISSRPIDSPKPDSEESKSEKIAKDGPPEESKSWDRNSKMPPQMMKRWFGGNPQTD